SGGPARTRAARGPTGTAGRSRAAPRLPRRLPLGGPRAGGGEGGAGAKRPFDVLVDAHCHLGDGAFDEDREAVLARARAAGVTHIIVIGAAPAESERGGALARGCCGAS